MSKRILIVDDSKVVREAVRTYVEAQLEYIACAEAADGREAIQAVAEVKPDLIVFDLCMPVMNGLEAAAILHERFPRLPMILYTMHKAVISETAARAAGIRALVSKMDPIDVLLEEILNFVGVARAATA